MQSRITSLWSSSRTGGICELRRVPALQFSAALNNERGYRLENKPGISPGMSCALIDAWISPVQHRRNATDSRTQPGSLPVEIRAIAGPQGKVHRGGIPG